MKHVVHKKHSVQLVRGFFCFFLILFFLSSCSCISKIAVMQEINATNITMSVRAPRTYSREIKTIVVQGLIPIYTYMCVQKQKICPSVLNVWTNDMMHWTILLFMIFFAFIFRKYLLMDWLKWFGLLSLFLSKLNCLTPAIYV